MGAQRNEPSGWRADLWVDTLGPPKSKSTRIGNNLGARNRTNVPKDGVTSPNHSKSFSHS